MRLQGDPAPWLMGLVMGDLSSYLQGGLVLFEDGAYAHQGKYSHAASAILGKGNVLRGSRKSSRAHWGE